MLVGAPGCASAAITVGCFVSRRDWVDKEQISHTSALVDEVMSPDSSPGPLRNGTQKPDLVTPGNVIVSSLAAQSSPSPGLIVTDRFKVDHGSSMSAAVASGLVALMLSTNRVLTAADVKAHLIAASSITGAAPGAFKTDWGFGLIDASVLTV